MKVLIVDDEMYILEFLRDLIDWKQYGFTQVICARGGSRAKDILDAEKPRLLITDIRMPRISGLDLAAYISEKGMDTKVIIVSGYGEFEYAKQAVHYGVSEYLVKPILQEDLTAAVEKILRDDPGYGKKEAGSTGNVIPAVQQYIQKNYREALSLEVLGEQVHLHPNYLSQLFKTETGQNISAYITDVRLTEAANLLTESDLKISEIMARVGYQKSQYFSNLFREKYGVTPKEYRRTKRFL